MILKIFWLNKFTLIIVYNCVKKNNNFIYYLLFIPNMFTKAIRVLIENKKIKSLGFCLQRQTLIIT